MHHLQLSGVQHRSRCTPLSIEPVACQRVADRGEMNADLMRAPGFQQDLEQGASRLSVDRMDLGDRALPVLADAKLDRADACDWRVDRLCLAELAVADRQIAL